MRAGVVLNPHSGSAAPQHPPDERRSQIVDAFRDVGVDVILLPFKEASLQDCVRLLLAGGAEAVVAAGGDGTVSSVAAVLAGTEVPLGALPLGPLNHFARDA